MNKSILENENFNNFFNIINNNTGYDRFMYLKIYIDNDIELKNKYILQINEHLYKIINDVKYVDAGFDIITPLQNEFESDGIKCYGIGWDNKSPVNKINFKIKCSAEMVIINKFSNNKNNEFILHKTGFYTYPRSSLSKTNLRLANNTGIIDAGYRGNLIGMFDVVNIERNYNSNYDYLIEPYTRLLQICSTGLEPIYVEIVDNMDQLNMNTLRGNGGIGSTGK
jgi:dUTP pyrophosphatase